MGAAKNHETTASESDCAYPGEPNLCELYGNERKWSNRVDLEKSMLASEMEALNFPWKIYLEPTSQCRLACCSRSRGDLKYYDLEAYLAELWPFLMQVNLFHCGEPFLHPDLPDLIGRIHRRDVGTRVVSGFQTMTNELAERIILSGLDVMIAAIEGATQKEYGSIRIGGDLAGAIGNLGIFLKIRRRLQSKTPRVIWKFDVHGHNEYETVMARELSRRLGVDAFVVGAGKEPNEIGAPKRGFSPIGAGEPAPTPPFCRDLWAAPLIRRDGRLMPCHHVNGNAFAYGNVKEGFLRAFNTPAFRNARAIAHPALRTVSPCHGCRRTRQRR